MLFEMLADRDDIGQSRAEVCDEIPHLRGVRPRTGHQARTGWRTNRLLAVGATEEHTHPGDPDLLLEVVNCLPQFLVNAVCQARYDRKPQVLFHSPQRLMDQDVAGKHFRHEATQG